MRRYSAWRLMPSSAAAFATTPAGAQQRLLDRGALRIGRRAADRSRSALGAGSAFARSARGGSTGRSPGADDAVGADKVARWTRFWSSRTLPGQSWCEQRGARRRRRARTARAPGANVGAGSARRAAGCRRGARRSGGSASSMTLRRKYRSSRKRALRRSRCCRSALVALMMRTSTLRVVARAEALELAGLQHAQELHLAARARGCRSRRGTACRRRPPRSGRCAAWWRRCTRRPRRRTARPRAARRAGRRR